MKDSIEKLDNWKDCETSIVQLLSDNRLPVSDLQDSEIVFTVYKNSSRIIGIIGEEIFGNDILIRSFAVDDDFKNQGIGKKLLDAALTEKATYHLLTTTAAPYFEKYGFRYAERSEAPESIQNTREFSGICPSSSAYMILEK